ncbi:sodium:solute symporter family protein [Megasphaera vaginalis (ex Bordigoni et al. 2020)]|nr:sodium:solute symporter family protein [Megasphaera vaginalis (ex Bordigoni et al. 2020)]
MGVSTGSIFIIVFSTLAVLLVAVLISWWVGRKSTGSDWAVAGRSLPLYVIVGTQFATAQGGGFLTAHVGNGYAGGWSALTYGLFVAIGMWVICLIAKWMRSQEFSTIPDIMERLYGKNKTLTVISSFLTMVVPFGWVIGNLIAFGKLYSGLTGLSTTTLVLAFAVISLLLVLPAGLKSVAWADFFFGCLMGLICLATLYFLYDMGGGFGNVMAKVPDNLKSFPGGMASLGWGTVILWFMAVIPGSLTNQMYFQRIFAAKDINYVKMSLFLSGVVIIISEIWASLFGMGIRAMNPGLEREMATGWFLTQIPVWFLALYAGLIVSAIMSTVASGIQSVALNAVNDIYKKILNPGATENDMKHKSKIISVIVTFLAVAIALVYPRVLNVIVATYAFSAAGLMFPIFAGVLLRRKNLITAKSVIISMIVGFIVCFGAMLMETVIPYAIYGLAGSGIALIIACMIFKDDKKVAGNMG